ncbi:hypothetical protein VNO78_30868 [Psophocarpus tetragonolobus]|uniref:Proteasome subunit beta n=1 Tax=Psophocarpus tetragonolobus TaxID=3891 RepID=A0AAN9X7G9_PSOTE
MEPHPFLFTSLSFSYNLSISPLPSIFLFLSTLHPLYSSSPSLLFFFVKLPSFHPFHPTVSLPLCQFFSLFPLHLTFPFPLTISSYMKRSSRITLSKSIANLPPPWIGDRRSTVREALWVHHAWEKGNDDMVKSLEWVRHDSLTFNVEVFGIIFKQKCELYRRSGLVTTISIYNHSSLGSSKASSVKDSSWSPSYSAAGMVKACGTGRYLPMLTLTWMQWLHQEIEKRGVLVVVIMWKLWLNNNVVIFSELSAILNGVEPPKPNTLLCITIFVAGIKNMSIFEYNGSAVVAMVGKNCFAIASDRRLGVQLQTIATDFQRISKIHDKLFIALSGLATDAQTLYQRLVFRHKLYQLREERDMKPETFASLVSALLYEKRFGPYFCQPVIAGLGDEDKPFICTMDCIGAKELAKDFVVSGTASESLYGACEAMFKPDMEPEELFETVSQALLSSVDRDCLSGWGGHVYVVTPTEVKERILKGRMD